VLAKICLTENLYFDFWEIYLDLLRSVHIQVLNQ